jgi:diguanylate cyclase (GGDEF)-like protein
MNETFDEEKATEYENKIICRIASPLMFISSIAYFFLSYLALGEFRVEHIINSLSIFFIGICFEILFHIKRRVQFVTYGISFLFSVFFVLAVFRLYHILGPSVWTIGCFEIVLANSRIRKEMSIIVGTVVGLIMIYVVFNSRYFSFQMGINFYISQIVLIFVLFIQSVISHQISAKRFYKMANHIKMVTKQKQDITELYEELSRREEELYRKNQRLTDYTEELKLIDAKLYEYAYFDILTNLPNRKQFLEKLDKKIIQAQTENAIFYIVFIDVDSFKKINDTMGHDIGDEYIRQVSERMKSILHPADLLGRIGGDEFALIVDRKISEAELMKEIENIRDNFAIPIKINNLEIRSTASFGISVFPKDATTATDLLKYADMSMYKAKSLGKNNVQFFQKAMKEEFRQRAEMEAGLISGMKNKEFFLVYQPQYELNSRKIRGFEVLLRWNSPSMGIVEAGRFIRIAEEIGLIIPLGEWVLEEACRTFLNFKEEFGLLAPINVNISVVQLMDPNFVGVVQRVLQKTGMEPQYLELEITESVFIESFHQIISVMRELKNYGLRLSLDNFGIGYSSLNYLRSLPIDTIKIDRSFIRDLRTDELQFVGDIISIGHNLGVPVIAEGVEDDQQLAYLLAHACDYAQGYYFQQPMEAESLRRILKEQQKP